MSLQRPLAYLWQEPSAETIGLTCNERRLAFLPWRRGRPIQPPSPLPPPPFEAILTMPKFILKFVSKRSTSTAPLVRKAYTLAKIAVSSILLYSGWSCSAALSYEIVADEDSHFVHHSPTTDKDTYDPATNIIEVGKRLRVADAMPDRAGITLTASSTATNLSEASKRTDLVVSAVRELAEKISGQPLVGEEQLHLPYTDGSRKLWITRDISFDVPASLLRQSVAQLLKIRDLRLKSIRFFIGTEATKQITREARDYGLSLTKIVATELAQSQHCTVDNFLSVEDLQITETGVLGAQPSSNMDEWDRIGALTPTPTSFQVTIKAKYKGRRP